MNPNISAGRLVDGPSSPIQTISDTLSAAQSLGQRVQSLHDALLGAFDMPKEVGSASGQTIRSGVLNDAQAYGNSVRSTLADANSALTRIEHALGVNAYEAKATG